MKIFIWRHGDAEKSSLTGKDQDRTLSPEGRNALIDVADLAFGKEGAEKPEKIFTSPFVRAMESAEMIQGYLGCARSLEVLPDLKSGASVDDLIAALKKQANSLQSFVFVGHMPELGLLVDHLLGRAGHEKTSIKAGGLLEIQIDSLKEPLKGTLLQELNPQDITS